MHVLSPVSSLAGPALRLQPDSRLIALAGAGEERAFEEIVRRYRKPLVAFAAGIVPVHRAEDVVQEALLRAHRRLSANDAVHQLRPWLYAIVRNLALNDHRDERTHEQLDENYDGVPQPPDIAARRVEVANLVTAIQTLPADQRAAIVKRELEGMTHIEIAAELDVTPQAARGLIFRARAALRSGVGCLIPLPLLRALLESEGASAAVGAGGATGVLGIAGGVGGQALVVKGAAALFVALAIGSGVALEHESDARGAEALPSSTAMGDPSGVPAAKSFEGAQGELAAQRDLPHPAGKSDSDDRGVKRGGASAVGGSGESNEHRFESGEPGERNHSALDGAGVPEQQGSEEAATDGPAGGGSADDFAHGSGDDGDGGDFDDEATEEPSGDQAVDEDSADSGDGQESVDSGDEREIEDPSGDLSVDEQSGEGSEAARTISQLEEHRQDGRMFDPTKTPRDLLFRQGSL